MFRSLFEKVRDSGDIDIGESPFVSDILPIIYDGEARKDARNSVNYYNSGGRSLIFNLGSKTYRVKGVDPHAQLTRKVVNSGKNRIKNVADAVEIADLQLNRGEKCLEFRPGQPFGPFTFEQAQKEATAFEILSTLFENYSIPNPCRFVRTKETGCDYNGVRTYQNAFELPNMEADFRVHEFDQLITERLDQCSPEEIAAKRQNICRLYGRFIYWAGFNAGLLSMGGLMPTEASFHPQNWVISRYAGGYGIFRVDHTSTRQCNREESLQALTREKDGVPFIINEFSVFPERVQLASDPRVFLSNPKRKFSEILFLTGGINVDNSRILEAHNRVFGIGLLSCLESQCPEPIPEEMFKEALK